MFLGTGFAFLGLLAELAVTVIWFILGFKGLSEFLTAPPEQKPPLLMVAIVWALGAGTAYAIYRRFQGAQEDAKLKSWLVANAERIRNNDPVLYRNQRIHLDTELIRHHVVFSAIIVSTRRPTRWLIKGREPRTNHALAASLYTMLYGWWGFPFGIYWTIVALVKNVNGSTTVTVRDLLQPAAAKPSRFNEKFQSNFGKRMRGGLFIDDKPAGILPAEARVTSQR